MNFRSGGRTPALPARPGPGGQDFFAACRRLRAESRRRGAPPPRFGVLPSLAFQPTSRPRCVAGDAVPVWRVPGPGLLGPDGAMPLHLLEDLLRAGPAQGLAADPRWSFFDIWVQPFFRQWYDAWADARPAPGMDARGPDPLTSQLAALAGVDPDVAPRRRRPGLGERAGEVPLWRAAACPAAALTAALAARWSVPLRLEPGAPAWHALHPSHWTRLQAAGGGLPLGAGLPLGPRLWQAQGEIRLTLGPLAPRAWPRWGPGGRGLALLCHALEAHLGQPLHLRVAWQRQPDADWARPLVAQGPRAPRLARDLWLGVGEAGVGDGPAPQAAGCLPQPAADPGRPPSATGPALR